MMGVCSKPKKRLLAIAPKLQAQCVLMKIVANITKYDIA